MEKDAGAAQPRRFERVGVLLIHGLGDQDKREHLTNVGGAIATALRNHLGPAAVSVTTEFSHTLHRSRHDDDSLASIAVRDDGVDGGFVVIDVREVWWRDLAENATTRAVLRFWWWALTFCADKKEIPPDTSEYAPPASETIALQRVPLSFRIAMFVKTSAIFILLLPVHLVFQIVAVFPLFQRIHFLRTVFAYLNSLRLYQQDKSAPSRRIDNMFECQRISILRRAAQGALHFARGDYDRWYILGHSLGSVIAHNLVNLSPQAFARLLTGVQADLGADSPVPASAMVETELEGNQNVPARPCWMGADEGLDVERIFQNLRGFLSYGSPLETFASFWPRLVLTRKATKLSEDFEWINLHDPADIVGTSVTSFRLSQRTVTPVNIAVRTHPLILFAHTSYLTRSKWLPGHRVARAVGEWIVSGKRNFESIYDSVGPKRLSRGQASRRAGRRLLTLTALIAFGALFVPRLIAALIVAVQGLATNIWNMISHGLIKGAVDGCEYGPLCTVARGMWSVAPGLDLLEDALVSVGVFGCFVLVLICVGLFRRIFSSGS